MKLNKIIKLHAPLICAPLALISIPLVTSCGSQNTFNNDVNVTIPTSVKNWTITTSGTWTKDQDFIITFKCATYSGNTPYYKLDKEQLHDAITIKYTYKDSGTVTNTIYYCSEEAEARRQSQSYFINVKDDTTFEAVIPSNTVNYLKTYPIYPKHFYEKAEPIEVNVTYKGEFEISDSISWSDIGTMIKNGTISNTFNLGDYKKMTISSSSYGEDAKVQILSFANTYAASSSTWNSTVTFGIEKYISSEQWTTSSVSTCYSYKNSEIYKAINNKASYIKNAIYDNLNQYPHTVKKSYIEYGASTTPSKNTFETQFFIPSMYNVFTAEQIRSYYDIETQYVDLYVNEGQEGLFNLFDGRTNNEYFWTSTPALSSSGSKAYYYQNGSLAKNGVTSYQDVLICFAL